MHNRHVYIGIETKVREFDAKVLLACAAAEAGYDVKLGHLKIFRRRLQNFPRGFFIEKSVTGERVPDYRRYARWGFSVVGQDEEGLSPWNEEEYVLIRKLSNETLRYLDCFLAWGPWHRNVIARAAPSHQSKILPVGNPRGDLTRKDLRSYYDDEVRKLRETYGQIILVNTNFAFCNHFHGENGIFEFYQNAGRGFVAPLESFYRGVQVHQKNLFSAFVSMIEAIHAQYPSTSIVLRPHPSENHERWRDLLPKSSNIHVVHEGNVVHWLLAANVMIHNSCTTGIEGYLLGRPILSFRPDKSTEYESVLPNALSIETTSIDDVLSELDRIFNAAASKVYGLDARDPAKVEMVQNYITAPGGELSCDRIVDVLNNLRLPERTVTSTTNQVRGGLCRIKGRLFPKSRSESTLQKASEYGQQKFPGITFQELLHSVNKFQALLGRFSNVEISQLESNLFRLRSNK